MLPDGFYERAENTQNNLSSEKKLNSSKSYDLLNLNDFIDGYEALRQTVRKILSTERYFCPIYSSDFGVETADLLGGDLALDTDYICAELEQRISEALLVDERITAITEFNFDVKKGVIHVEFIVHSVFSEFARINEEVDFSYG